MIPWLVWIELPRGIHPSSPSSMSFSVFCRHCRYPCTYLKSVASDIVWCPRKICLKSPRSLAWEVQLCKQFLSCRTL